MEWVSHLWDPPYVRELLHMPVMQYPFHGASTSYFPTNGIDNEYFSRIDKNKKV